jgi:TolA-binding protein
MPKHDPTDEITTHWLRGVLRCAACNSTLSYCKSAGKKQGFYRCSRYMAGGCSEAQGVTISRVENIVIDTLTADSEQFALEEFEKIRFISDENQIELQSYEKRLVKLNGQLEKARDLVLNGVDTPEEYKENRERINLQIADINNKKLLMQDKIQKEDASIFKNKIKGIVDILISDSSFSEKNKSIKEIASKIVYDKKNNIFEFNYFYISE